MKSRIKQRRHTILLAAIVTIFLLGAINSTYALGKGVATEAEIKAYFVKRNKDSTESMGWKNPQVTFQKIQIAAPVKYNFVGIGVKTCYPVKVSWTYSYENYNSKRTASYTGDFYRFYRNEFGDLTMGEHGAFEDSKTTDALLDAEAARPNAEKPMPKAVKPAADRKPEAANNAGKEGNPAPDFSAMEQWYEIVKYEYSADPTSNKMTVVFKPKTAERPAGGAFVMKYLDKDGVTIDSAGFYGLFGCEVGETCKTEIAIPHESDRAKVASAVVVRNKQ